MFISVKVNDKKCLCECSSPEETAAFLNKQLEGATWKAYCDFMWDDREANPRPLTAVRLDVMSKEEKASKWEVWRYGDTISFLAADLVQDYENDPFILLHWVRRNDVKESLIFVTDSWADVREFASLKYSEPIDD